MMRTNLYKYSAMIMLLVMIVSGSATYAESTSRSAPVGFHKFLFRHGWNLVSFPALPEDPSLQNTIGAQLTGSESELHSDRIVTFDPNEGEWLDAWLNEEGVWVGSLSLDTLRYDIAYWVLVREENPDSQEVLIFGHARDEEILQRGIFTSGDHLIGSIWAASLPLSASGLDIAGIQPREGLLPVIPEQSGIVDAEILMAYTPGDGWYQVAWFDGNTWRGDFSEIQPGTGYVLRLNQQHAWYFYPRPDILVPRSADPGLEDLPLLQSISLDERPFSDNDPELQAIPAPVSTRMETGSNPENEDRLDRRNMR